MSAAMAADGNSWQMIEGRSLEFRALVERAYAAAPRKTHSELVYMGFWLIASQMKIDFESGRLTE